MDNPIWLNILVSVGIHSLTILPAEAGPLITSTDHSAVPVGETITFSGTGFTGTTAVSFFWGGSEDAAAFNTVSGTSLEVTFPDVFQSFRDRFVLIQTPAGSTVSLAPPAGGVITQFTGNGPVPMSASQWIVIKAGAVATSLPEFGVDFVYVESGAVLQNVPADFFNGYIFAENGATLDFRGVDFSASFMPPTVIHSPGTTILGDLPPMPFEPDRAISREVPPLSLSLGIGPFAAAARVNITVIGNGSVTMSPDPAYARLGAFFTLTAVPDSGSLFHSWSGASTSSLPTIQLRAHESDSNINLTATFTGGYVLETFAGSRGTITANPNLAAYSPGQIVSLNAAPLPGYTFVGWGGSLSGQTATSANLTMNSNKIVSAIFHETDPAAGPLITSTDHTAVPVGETITFSGTGFTGTTAVSFFWGGSEDAAAFNTVSGTSLEVTFPDVFQSFRDRFVLIQTPAGSTVSLAPPAGGVVTQFTGNGPVPMSASQWIVIKAGAVATSLPEFGVDFVYVESGAVLQNVPADFFNGYIFAENGATLDFRGVDFSASFMPPTVIHSPGTTILGDLPPMPFEPDRAISREVPPLSLSLGIGPFAAAARVNITVIGNGSVTMSPDPTYARLGAFFTLTAVPDSGSLFHSWSGASTSSLPTIQLRAHESDSNINLTATFTGGYVLETFAGSRGTITANPNLAAYSPGQIVSLNAAPLPGYTFVGWGGSLSGQTATSANLTMNSNKIVSAIFHETDPAAGPLITSTDHTAVPVGETITFSGTGFTGTTAVSFFWGGSEDAAAFNTVSGTSLEVTFPDVFQSFRDRFVLIQTPAGSTVSLAPPAGGVITQFTGNGPVPMSASQWIVIKAGAVATSLPEFGVDFVYVESGAVLQNVPADFFNGYIFAENGATLDFRGVDFSASFMPPSVIHSPGTTILGDLPPMPFEPDRAISREVPPLSLSLGIGPFSEGYPLNLTVEGPGSILVDPLLDYYPGGTRITLTANPNSGNYFVRWMGALSSTASSTTYVIQGTSEITARFSNRPDFFSDWRARFFTPEELADPDITGLDQDPDHDQITNAGEYAFGTDPTLVNGGHGLRILPGGDPKKDGVIRLEYLRPTYSADISYILQARKASEGWFDGSAGDVTFTTIEETVDPQGDDIEKVTLLVSFTSEVPNSLFFRLTANLEDLP